eukprot:2481730-Pleurochrysis_carterae.AAC.1
MPALRTQATDHRQMPARPSRHSGSFYQMLLALILVLSGTATTIGTHLPDRALQPSTPKQRHSFLAPEPHATSFALAADTLETAACLALLNGCLLSAAWAIAKANVFWFFHTGQQHLPGRVIAPPRFATYRTHADLWRARCHPSPASVSAMAPSEPPRLTPEATNEPNVAP